SRTLRPTMEDDMGTTDERKWDGRARLSRLGSLAVVVAGLSLLTSACGGSPASHVAQLTTSSTTQSNASPPATDKYAASLAYSRCMRSHGLPNFPDPKEVGGGIQVSGSRSG